MHKSTKTETQNNKAMKKTIKINLSGNIFHIDEDAYKRLNDYLDRIHEHFAGQEGGEEIISDIEMRMAELFQDKLTDQKQVISDEDVEEVTRKLGEPQDFMEEEPSGSGTTGERRKKLYRDPDDAILGGVASGIGSYLNVDPVWIRLLFVLLVLGYGFIVVVYLLLWLIIPKASTYDQKLEMRGERVTVSDIERRVKNEYDEVRGNFRRYRHSEPYKNITKGLNEIFVVLGRILKVAVQVLLILIGVGLIAGGVVVILGMLGVPFIHGIPGFMGIFSDHGTALWFMLHSILDPTALVVLTVSLAVLVVIPVFLLFYAGLKLLTGFRANDQNILLSGLIVWIAALLATGGMAAWQVHEFTARTHTTGETTLNMEGAQTLNLRINNVKERVYASGELSFDDDYDQIKGTDAEGNLYISPELNIVKSPGSDFRLKIYRSSRGSSQRHAAKLADAMQYNWQMNDSTLTLGDVFSIPYSRPYRFQQMKIYVMVPEGGRIAIPEAAEEYLDDADNRENMWEFEMGGKVWQMGDEELRLYREKKATADKT